jgi:hypothetical protein
VSLPEPYPGMVVRYSYLWKREHQEGREEGTKDRPCAIVMAVTNEDDDQEVLLLPITHAPPADLADAIEIPPMTKKRLGLDADRSWIVITEANEFIWPGPDLWPIPSRKPPTVVYGPLPPRLFAEVRDKFLERDRREKKSIRVKRTE